MNKLTPVAKLHIIMEMLKDKEVCSTCGHETPIQPLITKEDALKLLAMDSIDEINNSR